MKPLDIKVIDCTLRDGGYYNNWDFDPHTVSAYLEAMDAIKVDFVEIGFRSLKNCGFKGGFAFSHDSFLNDLKIPPGLENKIGVMINASELVSEEGGPVSVLKKLFLPKSQSRVTLVRIACHMCDFENALPAITWLKSQGYLVGLNLMQVSVLSDDQIASFAKIVSGYPVDVLYFADSLGSLKALQVKHIIGLIQRGWKGEIGIHAHNNMGQALENSLTAVDAGVTWVDCTVTGMGRGAGNLQTEYAVLALNPHFKRFGNKVKLLKLIRHHFRPMQEKFGWGTNFYYYLAGQYGIHPTYIQQMLSDERFVEEDILAVIDYLKAEGGKSFDIDKLDIARRFYYGRPRGIWNPREYLKCKEVLLLGGGSSIDKHRKAIERYIIQNKPIVIALNTHSKIKEELIDLRIACHPIRLLADADTHAQLPQPLITAASMLPQEVLDSLRSKKLLDFGIKVESETFEAFENYCIIPNSLVISYALAVVSAGECRRVLLAGFDGYRNDDSRQKEVEMIFGMFLSIQDRPSVLSITPTIYKIPEVSVYGLEN